MSIMTTSNINTSIINIIIFLSYHRRQYLRIVR